MDRSTPRHGMGHGTAGVRRGVGGDVLRPSSQWREAAPVGHTPQVLMQGRMKTDS
jgi:hypothetical protein